MDLIIVDGDCLNLWNVPELERLLDAGNDTVWFFDDAALRDNQYNIYAAAHIPYGTFVEKGILLTKFRNGIMKYHRDMLLHTFGCKRWMIVVVDEVSPVYRKQYSAGIDSALSGTGIRYEIIFDDSAKLEETIRVKQELMDARPLCVICTGGDAGLAEDVRSVLAVQNDEWRFECHTGLQEDMYRHAEIILIAGRSEEDFMVPPASANTGRVRIWADIGRESAGGARFRDKMRNILRKMNETGWNLGQTENRIYGSCLECELLLTELLKGEISVEGLCMDERFVMWDEYGLPLTEKSYGDSDVVMDFLKKQCCLRDVVMNTILH